MREQVGRRLIAERLVRTLIVVKVEVVFQRWKQILAAGLPRMGTVAKGNDAPGIELRYGHGLVQIYILDQIEQFDA